eukprot:7391872-Prymnesium_polylepis.1
MALPWASHGGVGNDELAGQAQKRLKLFVRVVQPLVLLVERGEPDAAPKVHRVERAPGEPREAGGHHRRPAHAHEQDVEVAAQVEHALRAAEEVSRVHLGGDVAIALGAKM